MFVEPFNVIFISLSNILPYLAFTHVSHYADFSFMYSEESMKWTLDNPKEATETIANIHNDAIYKK